jgi:hypothetical protein
MAINRRKIERRKECTGDEELRKECILTAVCLARCCLGRHRRLLKRELAARSRVGEVRTGEERNKVGYPYLPRLGGIGLGPIRIEKVSH